MSTIHSVWGFIRRYKYLVVIAFFAVMVGFADENSYWNRHLRKQEIAALKAEMQEYQQKFEDDTKALEDLDNNREAVVRVAREKYFMKYAEEDLFVFTDGGNTAASQAVDEGIN